MSSLNGILSVAAQALITHQKSLAVTAHNISNAQTEGYSRQRAVLQAAEPLITPDGMVGRGVRLAEIDRVRDPLIDGIYRRESSSSAFHSERSTQLREMEEVFGEPSETGVLATLDAFWNSWSDLANDPLEPATRSVIRERAMELGDRFDQVVTGLDQIDLSGRERLTELVSRVNALGEQVAQLNGRIVAAEAGGSEAGDLRDQRDLALDELSTLVGVDVIERDSGGVGVYIQGQILVDATTSRSIDTYEEGGVITGLRFGSHQPITDPGGRIGGLVQSLRRDLADIRASIETLAADIITSVNDLHQTGVTPDGATGEIFFKDLDGGRLELTDDLLGLNPARDPRDAIAAGTSSSGAYEAGANDVALQISQLRDASDLGAAYSDLVASTGATLSAAKSSTEIHETLARQATMRREEVSGVALDEELAAMVQQQAAYGAAARIVTRVDEMLQTVLGMG
jgi:flagellar hook-associated protein 1 FlgK